MEKRSFIVTTLDKENAEFIRDRHVETLRKEGFYILENEVKEINYKWQVRVLSQSAQGEFDFE